MIGCWPVSEESGRVVPIHVGYR